MSESTRLRAGLPLGLVAMLCVVRPLAAAPAGDVAHLVATVRHGSEGARNRAAERLFFLQAPAGNEAIKRLATSADAADRAVGLWALAVVKPPGAARLVLNALSDDDLGARRAAVAAVGVLDLAAAVPALARLLRHEDPLLRGAVIRALARLGRPGLAVLDRGVRGLALEDRLLIVDAVAEHARTPAAAAVLARAAVRGPLSVRLLAAAALVRHHDPRGERCLVRLLQQRGDKGVRLQAARWLGDRGGQAAAHALKRAARDPDAQVRQAAVDALAALTARRSPPPTGK